MIVFLVSVNGIIMGIQVHHVVGEKATVHGCRCVVFRFDDIGNGYLENVQIAILNYFISNNQSVSLGLVMNHLDNESELVNTIRNGYSRNLFELGIHGWDHVDYTNLTAFEQQSSLLKVNQKMNLLFGNHSRIFIPPFNLFNNDTISSMQRAGMNILSSAIYYDEPDIIGAYEQSPNSMNTKIYHVPEMTDFSIFYNGKWVKAPIKFLLSDIDFDINTYGYSVVMIHPHNFAIQLNGSLKDIVDIDQLHSLNALVNVMKLKNITISSFSEAIGAKE
jgi:Polysaccharide deacetylase